VLVQRGVMVATYGRPGLTSLILYQRNRGYRLAPKQVYNSVSSSGTWNLSIWRRCVGRTNGKENVIEGNTETDRQAARGSLIPLAPCSSRGGEPS